MQTTIEITAERIAQLHAIGLTKRTPDQLDEINAAHAALVAAQAEYEAAVEAAWPIYTPAESEQWIGWWCYLPEPLANLYAVTNDTDGVSFDHGSSLAEHFPVSLWKKNAGKFRNQARKIRRAIKAATVSAVA